MAWTPPKTDWQGGRDATGKYVGDYFNLADYNRIKNNLQMLRDMAIELYPEFSIITGPDWTSYETRPYASDINQIEDNLEKICAGTYPFAVGNKKTYYGNVATIDYKELNRIESATLLIYNNLQGQAAGKRRLSFTLGGDRL